MKYVWIISCLLFVCSCNTVREDFVVNEDYVDQETDKGTQQIA